MQAEEPESRAARGLASNASPNERFAVVLDTTRVLARARDGDVAARAAVAQFSGQLLARLVPRWLQGRFAGLRRRFDEEDLVQSALRDVLHSLPRAECASRQGFRAWVLGVLRNKLRRKVGFVLAGRRDVRREVSLDMAQGVALKGLSPSEHAVRAEERERMQRELALLPARDRRILEMRYFEGCTWHEVGSSLDLSAEACQMACLRALRTLRTRLLRNQ